MKQDESAELFAITQEVRDRTRMSLRSFWVPLVVFGALGLGSAPVFELGRDWLVGVYWAIAGAVGFLIVSAYYRRREHRLGAQGPVLPYLLAGVALFAAAYLSGAFGGAFHWQALSLWGPAIGITAGWLVFAWLYRSLPLALAAAVVGALAIGIGFWFPLHAGALQSALFGAAFLGSGLAARQAETGKV